jgi:ABC-type molybdate transport system substrate-binding protein
LRAINRIHVLSGGAPKEVFALLVPKFEQQTGNKVKFTYASSRNCGKN